MCLSDIASITLPWRDWATKDVRAFTRCFVGRSYTMNISGTGVGLCQPNSTWHRTSTFSQATLIMKLASQASHGGPRRWPWHKFDETRNERSVDRHLVCLRLNNNFFRWILGKMRTRSITRRAVQVITASCRAGCFKL